MRDWHQVPLHGFLLIHLLLAATLARAADASWFMDLDGNRLHGLGPDKHAATVLVFIQPDCPISNQYAPTLNRLRAAYAPRDVAFHLVYADKDVTPVRARRHLKEYRLEGSALLDPKHLLVRQTGAKVTPECVVLDARGRRVYRGRIDNRYVAFGRKRPAPTSHELRDTLEAILAGKPVPQRETTAIGCYIYQEKGADK